MYFGATEVFHVLQDQSSRRDLRADQAGEWRLKETRKIFCIYAYLLLLYLYINLIKTSFPHFPISCISYYLFH